MKRNPAARAGLPGFLSGLFGSLGFGRFGPLGLGFL
jgi:hypothetical protein